MSQPTAYSYIRFSKRKQEAGDSIRRQDTGAKAWAERNKVPLDTSLRIDKGVSAFRGKNADLGSLGEFLRLVEGGRVPRGSYLVVESLDRLTRDDIQPALRLILGLTAAGVRIVQLTPVEMVYDSKSDVTALIVMIVELSRGHSESKMKSDRVGKAWREKKRGARDGTVMTERLPAWVRRDGDKLALIPERAAVVKRIFHLAASGYGIPSIIIKLREEKVPAWGGRERFLDDEGRPATTSDGRPRFRAREGERYGAGRWVRASVSNILTDRRATGEYQPRTRDDNGRLVADGPPVPNYYPAAVTQKEYHAAREGMRQRKTNPGRLGKREINVFSGLLHHAREKDETYIMTGRLSKSPGKPARRFQVLINRESDQGAGRAYSIPYLAFEDVVLSALREIDPAEVLGTRGEPDETLALAGELAAVESSIATIGREMDEHGESPTLFKRLREREARQRELAARLEAARQKAATPLSEAWGEAMSLAEALASAPDQKDARLRLRAALRRVVAGIWLLVVPREGQRRLFAVRVQFEGDRHRDYIALHVSASGRRPERWSRPFSSADVVALGRLDLRRPDHAARLEKALAAAELGDLAAKVDSRGGNLGAQ